jgi:site-specific DNA-methyltransferase (adenine-specific)
MRLYSENKNYKLYHGSMLEMDEIILPNSIDSIVTDPPYELGFMGKSWDSSGIAFQKETWKKCYDVLKPGGYLLAFGGSRTFHRIACAIEDAGFELRDTIMWIYGSGFPKSFNIELAIDKRNDIEDNKWKGWGTCLKPSFEPIIIARKPFEGSLVDNIIEYGVGGINIDECRIATTDYLYNHGNSNGTANSHSIGKFGKATKGENRSTALGRFPANTILTYDETDYDEVCGGFPNTGPGGSVHKPYEDNSEIYGKMPNKTPFESYQDSGSASRYFYCAKATKKDRNDGISGDISNIHPTVKPTELMQYLVRLVTPKGGTILDPFNGSGSTGKAVMYENREKNKEYKYIGVELTEEYLPISKARIENLIDECDLVVESKSDVTTDNSFKEVTLW